MPARSPIPVLAAVAVVVLAGTVGGVALAGTAAPASGVASANAVAPVSALATAEERRSGPTRIDACTTIVESGRYVLADDVRNGSPTDPRSGLGACIEIRANDVVLDGGGHTVAAGPNGEPGVVGVLVRRSNVTVRNLTVTRWGAGVAVVGAENATLLNVSAVENLGDGFFVENAPGATVRGGVVRASNTGVFVRNAPNATVSNVTVAENIVGVSVRNSDGATIRGANISRNRQYGLGVFASADVAVADSLLRDDGFAGVALAGADARLRNLTLSSNSSDWAVYAVRNSTAVGERVRLGRTTVSFEARDAALDPAGAVPPLPITERQVVGGPVFALPTGEDARLRLSIRYDDAELDRVGTTERTLSLWRFDAGEGWSRVETEVTTDRNLASATFANLSENGTVVALAGEGLAESANATHDQSSVAEVAASESPACASPASRYSC